jgi:hypothetical protein
MHVCHIIETDSSLFAKDDKGVRPLYSTEVLGHPLWMSGGSLETTKVFVLDIQTKCRDILCGCPAVDVRWLISRDDKDVGPGRLLNVGTLLRSVYRMP